MTHDDSSCLDHLTLFLPTHSSHLILFQIFLILSRHTMQTYEEAPPPPYPGAAAGNTESTMIASKGDYKGVPVYEIAPICELLFVSCM